MVVEIIGRIRYPETIAQGSGIRELERLRKTHGKGHWRKRKEVHWYEAPGIGKREFKIKVTTHPLAIRFE